MKSLVLYQFRYVGRPVFGQTRSSLKRDWVNSAAAYRFVVHGDGPIGVDIPTNVKVLDYRESTNGNSPDLVWRLITRSIADGYQYMALLDDDASFSDPVASMDILLKHLKKPKVGAVGPMDAFVRFHTFRSKKESQAVSGTAVPLDGPPWTTFGCQMYKLSALQDIAWRRGLQNILFRTDMFLYCSLRAAGWKTFQVPMRFSHRCSRGLRTEYKNPSKEDLLRAQKAIVSSYRFMFKEFKRLEVLPRLRRQAVVDLVNRGMDKVEAKQLVETL